MPTLKRPYAVFDIDGTLIRWQLYHAVADTMVKRSIINPKPYKKVLAARSNWKNRQSENSFNEYESALIKLIEKNILGLDYDVFCQVCADVVKKYENQVYTFTRDLITELKANNYLIFAISASPTELVSLVADRYGFDAYGASSFKVSDGKLIGRENLLLGEAKRQHLNQLIIQYDADTENSIAVGDTEGDIELLSRATTAIAFNPSRGLFDHAITKGWDVVVERKNVVYQLKYNYGQYILAPPRIK